MRDLSWIGDFNRDGKPDLVATQTTDGGVYLYPGTGTGAAATLGGRTRIATGFATNRPLF